MIDEILVYLENSSLIATVMSGIALGFTGVLVRAVLNISKEMVVGSNSIKAQLNISHRLDLVEELLYEFATAHKIAILGSSLTADNKATVLVPHTKAEAIHAKYLEILSDNNNSETGISADLEQVLSGFTAELEKIQNVAPTQAQDMLAKLREQLQATPETNQAVLGTIMNVVQKSLTDIVDQTATAIVESKTK
jgi:ElaB/YqjD/DUF883 family membrane-anchored ribosome-binding protein